MEEQNKAEVVTIKEAVDKVKSWLTEKDFEKAKQGCEEILSVEKDNTEIKEILEKVNKELGVKPEVPMSTAPVEATAPATPVAPAAHVEPVAPVAVPKKGKSHIGTIIVTVLLVLIAGGLVLSFIMGWLNPVFEWILGLLGM